LFLQNTGGDSSLFPKSLVEIDGEEKSPCTRRQKRRGQIEETLEKATRDKPRRGESKMDQTRSRVQGMFGRVKDAVKKWQ